jgi:acetolactate synthase-1/2/3 large subunit
MWFPKGAKLIHLDVDPTSIGRNWIPDIPVIGDAKLALTDLADYCAERIGKLQFQEMPRVHSILKMKQEFEDDLDCTVQSESSAITVLQILREARKIFDRDAILVHENGSLDTWSYSYFPVFTAGMDVIPAGQTCMGFGVAGVIGAKLALPRQQAVCVTGDGAFQMMMDNLSVAVQYDVSPTWIVLNNRSLGWIKWWQHQYYRDRYISVDFDAQPDFTKIAEAHKCFGRHVDHPGAVVSSLEAAIEANRNGIPAVLDFNVNTFDHYPSFVEFHNLLS